MKINEVLQLFESYKDAKRKFIDQGASKEEATSYINAFKQMQPRLSTPEKDISYWIGEGWRSFKYYVDIYKDEPSKRQIKKRIVQQEGDSIAVYSDDQIEVLIPLTTTASCRIGRNTRWCTVALGERNPFIYYLVLGLYIVYVVKGDEKYSAAALPNMSEADVPVEYRQYMWQFSDTDNNTISDRQFQNETGLTKNDLLAWYREHKDTIESAAERANISQSEAAYKVAHLQRDYIPEWAVEQSEQGLRNIVVKDDSPDSDHWARKMVEEGLATREWYFRYFD